MKRLESILGKYFMIYNISLIRCLPENKYLHTYIVYRAQTRPGNGTAQIYKTRRANKSCSPDRIAVLSWELPRLRRWGIWRPPNGRSFYYQLIRVSTYVIKVECICRTI